MKKTFIFALLLFTGMAAAHAQSKKDIKALKIKTATETITSWETGKEVTWKSEYSAFDKEGNTTEQVEYNADGSVKRKELNKFNAKGDKVEEIIIDNSGNKKPEADDKYKHAVYRYNAKGKEIEDLRYDEKGTLVRKTVTSYNSNGDRIMEITSDGSGKVLKKAINAYDSKGLKTERTIYDGADKMLKKHKFTYTY
jgi:Skp family chaperone for outer membrane proteins